MPLRFFLLFWTELMQAKNRKHGWEHCAFYGDIWDFWEFSRIRCYVLPAHSRLVRGCMPVVQTDLSVQTVHLRNLKQHTQHSALMHRLFPI